MSKDVVCVIPHYNRLHLLDVCVKLLRVHYPDLKIVVADDGSDPNAVRYIHSLPVDVVLTCTHKSRYRGATLMQIGPHCDREYYMYNEDDVLSLGCANVYGRPDKGSDCDARVVMRESSLLESAIEALKHPGVRVARLLETSAASLNEDESFMAGGLRWSPLRRIGIYHKYYHNHGTYLAPVEIVRVMDYRACEKLRALEKRSTTLTRLKWGAGDWAVVPDVDWFTHVGAPMSVLQRSARITKPLADAGISTLYRPVHLQIELQAAFLAGTFRIEMDELVSSGFTAALTNALRRWKACSRVV